MLEPKIYEIVFQGRQDGREVLEELARKYFDRPSYVRGDTHETAYNEGARSVIHFIMKRIAQSHQPEITETE